MGTVILMNKEQTLEIIAIVKKYLTLEKNAGFITLRVKNDDLNAVKVEIENVIEV